jgi:putative transposase
MIPAPAYHVWARGSRRQRTFFTPEDYAHYLDLLKQNCARWQVAVWAYCLMPNHMHLLAAPPTPQALSSTVGETQRRYARSLNGRKEWKGHLWQGRFGCCPILDETRLYTAARYVELNPVRANLVRSAEDWPWSSARAHLWGIEDPLLGPSVVTATWPDWDAALACPLPEEEVLEFRQREKSGFPLATPEQVRQLEEKLGRRLRRPRSW